MILKTPVRAIGWILKSHIDYFLSFSINLHSSYVFFTSIRTYISCCWFTWCWGPTLILGSDGAVSITYLRTRAMVCESGLLAVLMLTLIDARCSLTDPWLRFLFMTLEKLNGIHFSFVYDFVLWFFFYSCKVFFLLFHFLSVFIIIIFLFPDSFSFCRCNHFRNHQASLSFTRRVAKKIIFTKQTVHLRERNNLLVNLQFIHFLRSVSGAKKAAARCHYNFINFSLEMIHLWCAFFLDVSLTCFQR